MQMQSSPVQVDRTKLTPMMKQYFEIKDAYKDYILFYRLGDFYEMFFDDAVIAARELEITLTGRNCGQEERAPLCGVPYHAVEVYLSRMVNKGYKVAICEQVEDPATAKGIVKREVIRVVTPGTVIDPQMLDEKKNNYLAAIHLEQEGTDGKKLTVAVAYADITTGTFKLFKTDSLGIAMDELVKIQPAEILYPSTEGEGVLDAFLNQLATQIHVSLTPQMPHVFKHSFTDKVLREGFNVYSVEVLGIEQGETTQLSAGALMHYIMDTQKVSLKHFKTIERYDPSQYMVIDKFTRRNLELTETMRHQEKKGSLLWVLDQTVTALGSRTLKRAVEQPLMTPVQINGRLDAVESLHKDIFAKEELRTLLKSVYDLERLSAKVVYGSVNARDLIALKLSLSVLPDIKRVLEDFDTALIKDLNDGLDSLSDVHTLIEEALVDEPPLSLREGGLFRTAWHEELESLRYAMSNGKEWVLGIEQRERERTGIKTLKIGFNKVFGYYLEITKANAHLAPEDYIRKQTLANGERYITPELKEIEDKILGAEEKLVSLEYALFTELRQTVLDAVDRILSTADAIGRLDMLLAFAEVSDKYGYTRPEVHDGETLVIEGGRHPVVERITSAGSFVENDTHMDRDEQLIYIITGPNMAGKSTYLRQVALITLMAQIGCYVPAQKASIGVVDRIFTRVGASDDLSQGQSTFMVEMSELAHILHHATGRSLIILDEIGRGTSTYDGMSIAWATVEYLSEASGIRARTLFATHYHELTELEGKFRGVRNFRISVEEVDGDIVFLRRIVRGGASKSYGIQVAKIAGMPPQVIDLARRVLHKLEENDINNNIQSILGEAASSVLVKEPTVIAMPTSQLTFFASDEAKEALIDELKNVDVMRMTPLEAMNLLSELQRKARTY